MVSWYKGPKRVCYSCGSDKTFIDKRNCQHWRIDKTTNNRYCNKCWSKYFDNPKYQNRLNEKKREKYSKNFLRFKGNEIYLNWIHNIRTGICLECKQKRHTNLHHWIYITILPWFGLEELCVPCHNKKRIGSHYNKIGKVTLVNS